MFGQLESVALASKEDVALDKQPEPAFQSDGKKAAGVVLRPLA